VHEFKGVKDKYIMYLYDYIMLNYLNFFQQELTLEY